MVARQPPRPPTHPPMLTPPFRMGLTARQEGQLVELCAELHSDPEPWLAWARLTARTSGAADALARASWYAQLDAGPRTATPAPQQGLQARLADRVRQLRRGQRPAPPG